MEMRRAEAIGKRVRRLDLVGFLWRSECDDDDDDLAILNLIFIVMGGGGRDFRDLMGLFLLGMKRRDSVINELSVYALLSENFTRCWKRKSRGWVLFVVLDCLGAAVGFGEC